jgi:rod shape determining protein RodA
MALLKKFDWLLFLLIVLIISLGAVTILSVNPLLFSTEVIYILTAIVVFFLISGLDLKILEGFYLVFYSLTIFLLVLPHFFGVFSRGSVRWLQVGSFTFQPSEFAKPFLIIFFAKFWAERRFSFKNLLICFLFLLPPVFFIFHQPDLGSSLVIISLVTGIVLASEINPPQLIILVLTSLAVLPTGWLFLKDYQKVRIKNFLYPSLDPLGAGYNVIQAIITIGSGGLFGKGLGRGTQSHLAFLPERHTDFIFASFAEEFGWAGSILMLVFYFFLLRRILQLAFRQKNRFAYNLCLGVFSFIFFQVVVNVGMNLGLMPITGITLPLFSFGGSSLVSTMICLGMIEIIFRSVDKGGFFEIGSRS